MERLMDDDALQALAYAMELEHQHELEQQMLAADPGYTEFLRKVENDNEHRST